MAEDEVAHGIAQGLDAVFLNPANVIGRYDWGTWSQFIRLAANRQLFRIPPGRACYADVEQWCARILRPSRRDGPARTIFLAEAEASYAEIVQMVGRLLGQPTNTGVGRPACCAAPAASGTDLGDHREGANDYPRNWRRS